MRLRQQDIDARNALLAQGLLRCTKCGETKSVEEFSKNKSRWSGRSNTCKRCYSEYKRTYRRDPAATAKRNLETLELRKRDLKVCSGCRHLKCRSQFNRSPQNADGLSGRCRSCSRASAAESHTKAMASEPCYDRLRNGYKRAKAAGLPHHWFTGDELKAYWESQGISPDHDAYTGQPLEDGWHLEHVHALSSPTSPGHVVSNVVPANPSTNISKHNKSLVDFLADRQESGTYTVDEATRSSLLNWSAR